MQENENKLGISSFGLKIFAIITMILDHSLKTFLCGFNMPIELWCFGRMSFPIFAFLIAEGARHTGNIKKYALRIGVFAILSEVIYDMTFRNSFFDFSCQNVLFELFLGVVLIWCYKYLKTKNKKEFAIFPLLMCAVFAELLHFDYGMGGILCIFLFYIAREKSGKVRYILYVTAILMTMLNIESSIVLYLQMYSLFALFPICFYNGEKGSNINKYVFYSIYPIHLVILWAITLFVV